MGVDIVRIMDTLRGMATKLSGVHALPLKPPVQSAPMAHGVVQMLPMHQSLAQSASCAHVLPSVCVPA